MTHQKKRRRKRYLEIVQIKAAPDAKVYTFLSESVLAARAGSRQPCWAGLKSTWMQIPEETGAWSFLHLLEECWQDNPFWLPKRWQRMETRSETECWTLPPRWVEDACHQTKAQLARWGGWTGDPPREWTSELHGPGLHLGQQRRERVNVNYTRPTLALNSAMQTLPLQAKQTW